MRNKFYKLNKYIGLLAEAGLTLEGRRSRQTESLSGIGQSVESF